MVLRFGRRCGKIRDGSVAEWLKAHDSKSCRVARLSEVRIPSLPPRLLRDVLKSRIRLSLHSNRIPSYAILRIAVLGYFLWDFFLRDLKKMRCARKPYWPLVGSLKIICFKGIRVSVI